MLFSSLVFLWFFFPVVFIASRLLPPSPLLYKNKGGAALRKHQPMRAQNGLLLVASLLFYAWGEPKNILLMLFSISANWGFGLLVSMYPRRKKAWLVAAVIVNLGLLGFFKYTDFTLSGLNALFGTNWYAGIALPIGISFYTFQALSYVIDVYRKDTPVQKSWFKLALYISFFPQLIAGPIVQYPDIAEQLSARRITPDATAYGVKRFIYGLAKKVLLANSFGRVADQLFGLAPAALSTPLAWLAAIVYALQIYYDFSGYSDMAIGLGKMFGFTFKENFNYPYISASCTEFWRRWHISLSSWFREYLYIPLGGNRNGTAKTYRNLMIVFFCTGLWHGASVQFIVWGMYYGVLLVLERLFLGKLLAKLPVVNRVYTLVSVLVGWVIFRAGGMRAALQTIAAMFIPTAGSPAHPLPRYLDSHLLTLLVFGIVFCGLIQVLLPKLKAALYTETHITTVQAAVQLILFFLCITMLVAGTYNPFIYFRF